MNKKTFIVTFLCIPAFLGMSSCTAIFTGLYGMKKWKAIDEKTIVRYAKKYNIPDTVSYQLDTSYRTFLASLDASRFKEQIKNHYQPLQALYFDHTGQLRSFQINCYAGGFPNLNWDRDEILTTFPPKQQAPLDSLLSLEKQLTYLRPVLHTESVSEARYDYMVIVYWSRFMGRQSKRLIRFVQDNSKLAKDQRIKIIYANTDNTFAEP